MQRTLPRLAAAALFVATTTATAHDRQAAADAGWTVDPWIVLPLAVSIVLYAVGTARLRLQAGRWQSVRTGQATAFAIAWLALAGALVSPLHWLGERVFSWHMVEHEIVMAVAAPLFVVARPAGVLLWALPRAWRRAVGAAAARRLTRAAWDLLSRPGTATLLHGAAIWLWHVPAAFDAAVGDVALHRLQHLSFFATALLFWWAMLRRSSPGVALWDLFVTMVHTSVLGAWIALAPRVLYRLQTAAAPAFGLTAIEDQQLAGVIMWVPAETVYAGAALAFAAAWIRRSGNAVAGGVR